MIENLIHQDKSPESKYAHLAHGVSPITTCIGANRDFYSHEIPTSLKFTLNHLNFFESKDNMDIKNIANAGELTYAISPIDEKGKLSTEYQNCTAIVAVGQDRDSGQNISFISHQNPNKFLSDVKDKFIKDLNVRLSELKSHSKEGTIDIIIVGGNYADEINLRSHNLSTYANLYQDSINLISDEVEKVFNFKPEIINGPKTIGLPDNIYFDSENRRLYFARPEVNQNIDSFTANNFYKEKDKLE